MGRSKKLKSLRKQLKYIAQDARDEIPLHHRKWWHKLPIIGKFFWKLSGNRWRKMDAQTRHAIDVAQRRVYQDHK
jgi:hypothetical protein